MAAHGISVDGAVTRASRGRHASDFRAGVGKRASRAGLRQGREGREPHPRPVAREPIRDRGRRPGGADVEHCLVYQLTEAATVRVVVAQEVVGAGRALEQVPKYPAGAG